MLADIDIVYLWCDINDEKFRRKKADFSGLVMPSKESDHACHYRSNDELKYSLRSVEKYAPWIRNIYIVTDEQTPLWLNAEHPQIKIIDVKEIMPETALPCFNSCAIEHCLDNIPGLSECFLYSNDDMFFANPVFPEDFFTAEGEPICRYVKVISNKRSGQYIEMCRNANKLISTLLDKKFNYGNHHNIDAYKKSDIKKVKEIFKEEIERTIHSHFRNGCNIHRMIYTDYSCLVGNGVFKKVIAGSFWENVWMFLKNGKKRDSKMLFASSTDKLDILKKYNPLMFCLNDDTNCDEMLLKKSRKFLENIFPEKSCFEK